jgi:hypothetical protein
MFKRLTIAMVMVMASASVVRSQPFVERAPTEFYTLFGCSTFSCHLMNVEVHRIVYTQIGSATFGDTWYNPQTDTQAAAGVYVALGNGPFPNCRYLCFAGDLGAGVGSNEVYLWPTSAACTGVIGCLAPFHTSTGGIVPTATPNFIPISATLYVRRYAANQSPNCPPGTSMCLFSGTPLATETVTLFVAPEPSTYALMATGFMMVGLMYRRRTRV